MIPTLATTDTSLPAIVRPKNWILALTWMLKKLVSDSLPGSIRNEIGGCALIVAGTIVVFDPAGRRLGELGAAHL